MELQNILVYIIVAVAVIIWITAIVRNLLKIVSGESSCDKDECGDCSSCDSCSNKERQS